MKFSAGETFGARFFRAGPPPQSPPPYPRADGIPARESGLQGSPQLQRFPEGCGVKRLTGLDWPILTAAACLLALTIAGATGITHFDDANVGYVLLLQSAPYAVA